MTSPCDNSFVECEARPSWMSPRKRRSLYQAAVGTAAPPHRIDRKQVQLSAVAIDFTVPSKLQQELLDELSRAKEVADSSSTKLPLTSRFPTSIGLNMISAQEPLRRRGAQPLSQSFVFRQRTPRSASPKKYAAAVAAAAVFLNQDTSAMAKDVSLATNIALASRNVASGCHQPTATDGGRGKTTTPSSRPVPPTHVEGCSAHPPAAFLTSNNQSHSSTRPSSSSSSVPPKVAPTEASPTAPLVADLLTDTGLTPFEIRKQIYADDLQGHRLQSLYKLRRKQRSHHYPIPPATDDDVITKKRKHTPANALERWKIKMGFIGADRRPLPSLVPGVEPK